MPGTSKQEAREEQKGSVSPVPRWVCYIYLCFLNGQKNYFGIKIETYSMYLLRNS
ncbi:hypothetical protein Hanom_Chr11g01047041 [Helianthus anomalus]